MDVYEGVGQFLGQGQLAVLIASDLWEHIPTKHALLGRLKQMLCGQLFQKERLRMPKPTAMLFRNRKHEKLPPLTIRIVLTLFQCLHTYVQTEEWLYR